MALHATKLETEARLNEIDNMISSGYPASHIVGIKAQDWGLQERQVRNLVRQADERAAQRRKDDAPHIRERQLRKAERLYAVCLKDKKHAAAVATLALEAKLMSAIDSRDDEVEAMSRALGPPPTDAIAAQEWLRKKLLIAIHALQRNESIEPTQRLQMIADIASRAAKITSEDAARAAEAERASRDADAREQLTSALAGIAAGIAAREDPQ